MSGMSGDHPAVRFGNEVAQRNLERSLESSEWCLNRAHGAGRVASCAAGEHVVSCSRQLVFKSFKPSKYVILRF